MNASRVVFSHGLDGVPWGGKIEAMAAVARSRGLGVASPDYRGMREPETRIGHLLATERLHPERSNGLILVGSSMGAYVAAVAAETLQPAALFFVAPAFYLHGYEQYTVPPPPCPVALVHGWHDEVVPVENSIRYARAYRATLHLLDGDHRLLGAVAKISALFGLYLDSL